MEITINGEKKSLEDGSTVASLMLGMKYTKSKAAVWVNKKQLLLAEYETHILSPGDELKIIRLFGGG